METTPVRSNKLCEDCDELIPEKRLKAVLNARRCVPCQSKKDLDPIEALGPERLAKAMAVMSEGDGEQFKLGGDSCVW